MDFNQTLFTLGTRAFSLGDVIFAAIGLFLLLLLVLLIMMSKASGRSARAEKAARERMLEMETRLNETMADVVKAQSEMTGRMQNFSEVVNTRQADLSHSLNTRMDTMTQRLGQSLVESTKSTHQNLQALGERLAVIDKAQANITELSSQVVELQTILNNKQSRGAFGQARMEAIVQDNLPQGSYSFQATLTNGKRPDALIHLPNGAPSLVIDSKFPLEAWSALRTAETAEDVRASQTQFKRDVDVHIKDISGKYFINGETQDTAFMFVPSESIFADIHEHFQDLVQKAHRARIVIVSPSLLMLSIQVVQSVLRDQRMREQAHIIQKEVIALSQDVARLDERVSKLQTHFAQTNKDVEQILTSTRKITSRGGKIAALDFEDGATSQEDEKKPAKSTSEPSYTQPDLLAGE